MLNRQYLWKTTFGSKIAVTNIVLVANAIVWYASILMVLENSLLTVGEKSWLDPNSQIAIWGLHFAGLILSAFIGAKISGRIDRTKFLILWMILNTASSLALFGLNYTNFTIAAVLVSLFGISFGLGMPMCMSYFSDSVPVENRGRASGAIMLISGIGIFAFAAAPLNLFELGILLSMWRLSILVIFLAAKSSLRVEPKKGTISFKNVLNQRSFLTYYVPWVLFSFVNFLVPLQPTVGFEPSETTFLIQIFCIGIFAVAGGFLLDSIGRKRIAITGFVMLGLSAAARGLDATSAPSLFFSAILEGSAWGLLFVLFIFTLWGDLSYSLPSDKYYVVGVTPFFISMLIGVTFGNQIANSLPATSLFPFAAFFLFIAVLPLFYSPETLPDKIIKGRELKSYLEKAQKFAQKETEKNQRNETKKDQEKDEDEAEKECENDGEEQDYVEFEVGQEVMEKAQELAEKYY